MKGALTLLLFATVRLAAQHSVDSARITVSPECTQKECWPYGVLITARGAIDFVQALSHRTSTIPAAETATWLNSAANLADAGLPIRIDDDPVLCPKSDFHQPVITVTLYRAATEWRQIDFRWCQPADTGSTPGDMKRIAALHQLRAFEDSVRALPFVTTHVKP